MTSLKRSQREYGRNRSHAPRHRPGARDSEQRVEEGREGGGFDEEEHQPEDQQHAECRDEEVAPALDEVADDQEGLAEQGRTSAQPAAWIGRTTALRR